MSETTTQAMHELLKGLNQGMNTVTRSLEIISDQLLAQTRAAGSPALGFCGPHVAEWIAGGCDPGAEIPAAQAWFAAQNLAPMPVCLGCFKGLLESVSGSRLVAAQPLVPERIERLIVPGR